MDLFDVAKFIDAVREKSGVVRDPHSYRALDCRTVVAFFRIEDEP